MVLRAFGQFPIKRTLDHNTSPSKFFLAFNFLFGSSLVLIVATSITRLPTTNIVLKIANDIVGMCALVNCVSTIIGPILFCKKICAMFDVVDAIDKLFGKLKVCPDDSIPQKYCLFFVFFTCILFAVSISLEKMFPLWSNGLGAGFYFYQMFCILIHVFLSNILYILTHLKVRFRLINNLLERMKQPRSAFEVSFYKPIPNTCTYLDTR